jgi:beta-phosphoglucomutase-like phosphatase (HAD superfamily)
MMHALEAIIFDFDGVIADSERLHLAAYKDVLAPMGLKLSDEAYYQEYLGYDDVGVFRRFARNGGLDWDDSMVTRLVEDKAARYEELTARGEMLFPGSAEFIRAAADVVPIAIASGALTHEIEEILERVQLRPLFTAIVGADQSPRSKPSPDPYLEVLYRLAAAGRSVDRDRAVAIEDSHWGLVSAATAGLRCVAVATTYGEDALKPHAELVVSGLNALTLDALDALCASPPLTGARRSHRA